MPDSGAPLFGLRWVPDEQLRPLRYLPAAYLPGQSRQSVRVLTQRLSEAQESVRQKSEQIRWLKEMTKDDASRARVARWMRGPLLRVFLAWKRCVREAALAALDDLRGEVSSAKAREHELQAKGDDLSRDHAVLQAALDHFFDAALANRAKARLRVCWRRWAVTRLVIASAAGGTQLKLTLAVLDSLKRELARERAALASARAEGKQYDQVAEAALTMLQQLREEGSGLHSRLAQLEEAKLRTEQALLKRDAELYESGRAQHSAARALGIRLYVNRRRSAPL
ncbi:hypothetical protein Ctob_006517 [Chrysochromulina tobinii]|uniref:Uncharacterized protein n=1 Tax=Chrysochromulina tobinii TaxID=1460289 RepID=A0A0M0K1L4_9EUKA|nr:hypothetical protein Ctob_006517 [Chrysochromulina tobinii]|eukprot:KOO32704.1 hypothetical protein Ctob_006517 [Chrysochromulina sp. CCMP291]